MKKTVLLISVLLLSLLFTGCSSNNNQAGPDNKAKKLSYDIIDKSGLSNSNLKDWYEKSYQEFGYHFTSDDKGNRYVLISAGEKPTGGYELILESVEEDEEKVTFVAKLESPNEDQMVTEALTYPHLLIKSYFGDKEIDAEMRNVDKAHMNITGLYIGRIDNNSVEIDIDNVGFKEGIQAFRLNDETRNWFDKNNLETKTRIKFDVLKNKEGQLIITKVKASGDEVEDVIVGYFNGQIDNNFIEVEIDGEPREFKLSDDFKKSFNNSIYEEKKVAMLCIKDKTYEYIVLDMKPLE